jgi:hypothetical protein
VYLFNCVFVCSRFCLHDCVIFLHVCVCMLISVKTHVCVFACLHVACLYVCVFASVCAFDCCVFVCAFVCLRICVCISVFVRLCVYPPTQGTAPGLQADPVQPGPQEAPEFPQGLLHPLGLEAPPPQHGLMDVA